MVSSDIFQKKINNLFKFCDHCGIYYQHNVCIKSDSNHYVNRVAFVLKKYQMNNLLVHKEGTFVASQRVDYLEYTLTTKGIECHHQRKRSHRNNGGVQRNEYPSIAVYQD